MQKAILSLLILISLSAFIFKLNSKPVKGIEINIRNSEGSVVYNGRTDKRGAYNIKLKDKGNYAMSISSKDILKVLTRIDKRKKASYLVTVVIVARSESWDLDTEKQKVETEITTKNETIEITREIDIGDANAVNEWPEPLINIISKGNGEIKGSVTFKRK